MDTTGASGVTSPLVNAIEDTGSMVEIKIKTLEPHTYTLRVDKCVPVPQLKEQIAIATGVVSEQQRLICRGKVLKDDELLSAYHVEDGHTLHLVIRQPHQRSTSTGQMGLESTTGNPDNISSTGTSGNRGLRTLVVETINIGQGDVPPQHITQIISSILNAVATAGPGSNTSMTDQRDVGVNVSGDTSSSEPVSWQVPLQASGLVGPQQPNVIPDSLTSINQYLSFMRDEFSREGFGGRDYRNHESSSVRPGVLQSHHTESLQPTQSSQTNPTSLAVILRSTRELLSEQAGGYISEFTRQLEDHVNVTDPVMRMGLQSNVMRTGSLLQDLGSLLLELARTTMTLRMGRTPSEAVINAGPAVYITGSGPNPVMVQPVPFYPGSSFGILRSGSLSGLGPRTHAFGSAFLPVNFGIPHGSTVNQGHQVGLQQPHERTDATGNLSGAANAFQTFPGISDVPSFAGTSGVRVVPLRTVVAVPAGVAGAPSHPLGTAVGLIYPVISRVHVRNESRNDATSSPASNESNQDVLNASQQLDFPPLARQNFETNTRDATNDVSYTSPSFSVENLSTNGPARHQGSSRAFTSVPSPQGETNGNQTRNIVEQFLRSVFPGAEIHVHGSGHRGFGGGSAANQVGQDGSLQSEGTEAGNNAVFFSNMVRQIMPFISRDTSTVQDGSPANHNLASEVEQRSNDASSSQHLRDSSDEAPSSKRQKREGC